MPPKWSRTTRLRPKSIGCATSSQTLRTAARPPKRTLAAAAQSGLLQFARNDGGGGMSLAVADLPHSLASGCGRHGHAIRFHAEARASEAEVLGTITDDAVVMPGSRLLEAGHDGRPSSLKADAVRSFLSAIGSRNQFLPLALDLRNALRRRRQIFWHCAPELFDGLADFAADLKMHSVRLELVFHALAAELILRLRSPKEIGREFGAVHVR